MKLRTAGLLIVAALALGACAEPESTAPADGTTSTLPPSTTTSTIFSTTTVVTPASSTSIPSALSGGGTGTGYQAEQSEG